MKTEEESNIFIIHNELLTEEGEVSGKKYYELDDGLKYIKEKIGDNVRVISVGGSDKKVYVFHEDNLHYNYVSGLGLSDKYRDFTPNVIFGVGKIKDNKIVLTDDISLNYELSKNDSLDSLRNLIDYHNTKHHPKVNFNMIKQVIKNKLKERRNGIALLNDSYKKKGYSITD